MTRFIGLAVFCAFAFLPEAESAATESLVAANGPQSGNGVSDAHTWAVIHAGRALLVPGEGLRENISIVVRSGVIERVSEGYLEAVSVDSRAAAVRMIDLREAFVLPGLMDAHVHITLQGPPPQSELYEVSHQDLSRLMRELRTPAEAAVASVANARAWLMNGYTTVRDVGAAPAAVFALRDGVAEGVVPGPRIYAAGAPLSPTGGHGDPPATVRTSRGEKRQGICDSAAECRQEIRRQIRNGSDLIKVHATGGASEESGNAQYAPSFTDEELEAIVRTAHGLGRKIAAHAHGATGINAALRAGVDSIEHGDGLNAESIELFVETGAYLVPTLSMVSELQRGIAAMDKLGRTTPYRARRERVIREMPHDIHRAWEAGVKIAAGSDRYVSENVELNWYTQIGMSPTEAIKTATLNVAALIGIQEQAGSLEVGKWADIIAVRGNPLEDIAALEQVVFVMKNGEVFKTPER